MFRANVGFIMILIRSDKHSEFDTITFGKNMLMPQYGVLTSHCHNFGTRENDGLFLGKST